MSAPLSSPFGVVWLTGLSGSGKSTLAAETCRLLTHRKAKCTVIDGDVLRRTVSRDLSYSDSDRKEQTRRAGEHAISQAMAGYVAIVALISPFEEARQRVRQRCHAAGVRFTLVHVATPLAWCEAHDSKGLYKRARTGELARFTGVSSAYEPPQHADLVIDASKESRQRAAERLTALIFTGRA